MIFLNRVRPGRDHRGHAARDVADGRADLLHAAPRPSRPDARTTRQHAPVRLRLGAAARRDPRRLARADRLRHPRALRHDRNQHDHVQPLRGRAQGRDRRLSAARRQRARRARRRPARPWRRARSASSRSRARTSSRLLADAGEDGAGVPPGRLLHHRRLGLVDADGYVHIVGRAKDLIISGGFNVYPKEVEAEIDAIAGVLESAVIGVPHPDFGEGVTAVVVPRPGAALDRRRRSSPRSAIGWRNSRRRSGCSSSTRCRATRWARCRRRSCGGLTRTSIAPEGGQSAFFRAVARSRGRSGGSTPGYNRRNADLAADRSERLVWVGERTFMHLFLHWLSSKHWATVSSMMSSPSR